jgi:hypothetical protein
LLKSWLSQLFDICEVWKALLKSNISVTGAAKDHIDGGTRSCAAVGKTLLKEKRKEEV